MSFGVTSSGFVLKRLEDIKAEIETDLREQFGEINTDADSVFGQLIGVFSFQLAQIWEKTQDTYLAMYPNSAEGVSLDGSAQLVGVSRLAATKTRTVTQLQGTISTVVPDSTLFSQSSTGLNFEVVEEVTILATALHKAKVIIDTAQDSTLYSVTINGTVVSDTSGAPATKASIAEMMADAINANGSVNSDVTASYTAGDEFYTIVSDDLSVSITFSLTATDANQSVEEYWTPCYTEAVDAGANPTPVASINTIVTPVSGLDAVTNLSQGTTGQATETDVDFRLRRAQSLQVTGAATVGAIKSRLVQDLDEVSDALVYENRTDVTDGDGRPPHSFEAVVEATDDVPTNNIIAQKLWELKAAGINTHGSSSGTATDENGDPQVMNFSHITEVLMWVELSYDTTGAEQPFPSGGEDAMEEDILRIGATFGISDDILIQKFVEAGYVVGGVTAVTIRLKEDGGSYQTTNFAIGFDEKGIFDASRITIIDVTP